jgi:hypothetical protein
MPKSLSCLIRHARAYATNIARCSVDWTIVALKKFRGKFTERVCLLNEAMADSE